MTKTVAGNFATVCQFPSPSRSHLTISIPVCVSEWQRVYSHCRATPAGKWESRIIIPDAEL